MEDFMLDVTAEERAFYGDRLILLEGIIWEFLTCVTMIRRYQVSLGRADPVTSCQARIKRAGSMREKLRRHGLPVTADSALRDVRDAAGVRLICSFTDDIYRTAGLLRQIPGVRVEGEKDYVQAPKPNGYRSYHMVLTLPLRFLASAPEDPVWLEVQIRTIAMDCWASIEHQLKYKREIAHQKLIVQELKRCADEMISTDLSLQTIRDLLGPEGGETVPCGS